MNLLAYVVGGLMIAVVVGLGIWLLEDYRKDKKRRVAAVKQRQADQAALEAKKQATALAWVEAVEVASTDEDLSALTNPNYYGLEDVDRLKAAITKHYDARKRVKARQWRSRYDEAPVADRPDMLLRTSSNGVERELAFSEPAHKIGQRLVDDMATLLERFRQGDLVAMVAYRSIVQDRYYLDDFCQTYNVKQRPEFPADWDDLVDTFVQEPAPSDYVWACELTVPQVRTMAAEAVKESNPLRAKRALALCRKPEYVYGAKSTQLLYPYQDALGDHMLFVLQMLVADPANIDQYLGCVDR